MMLNRDGLNRISYLKKKKQKRKRTDDRETWLYVQKSEIVRNEDVLKGLEHFLEPTIEVLCGVSVHF